VWERAAAGRGELVTVIPVQTFTVNFPGQPDPANAVTVTAVFTSRAKTVIMGEHSARLTLGHSVSPLVSTSEPIFDASDV
jgi:hypothetical protein